MPPHYEHNRGNSEKPTQDSSQSSESGRGQGLFNGVPRNLLHEFSPEGSSLFSSTASLPITLGTPSTSNGGSSQGQALGKPSQVRPEDLRPAPSGAPFSAFAHPRPSDLPMLNLHPAFGNRQNGQVRGQFVPTLTSPVPIFGSLVPSVSNLVIPAPQAAASRDLIGPQTKPGHDAQQELLDWCRRHGLPGINRMAVSQDQHASVPPVVANQPSAPQAQNGLRPIQQTTREQQTTLHLPGTTHSLSSPQSLTGLLASSSRQGLGFPQAEPSREGQRPRQHSVRRDLRVRALVGAARNAEIARRSVAPGSLSGVTLDPNATMQSQERLRQQLTLRLAGGAEIYAIVPGFNDKPASPPRPNPSNLHNMADIYRLRPAPGQLMPPPPPGRPMPPPPIKLMPPPPVQLMPPPPGRRMPAPPGQLMPPPPGQRMPPAPAWRMPPPPGQQMPPPPGQRMPPPPGQRMPPPPGQLMPPTPGQGMQAPHQMKHKPEAASDEELAAQGLLQLMMMREQQLQEIKRDQQPESKRSKPNSSDVRLLETCYALQQLSATRHVPEERPQGQPPKEPEPTRQEEKGVLLNSKEQRSRLRETTEQQGRPQPQGDQRGNTTLEHSQGQPLPRDPPDQPQAGTSRTQDRKRKQKPQHLPGPAPPQNRNFQQRNGELQERPGQAGDDGTSKSKRVNLL